MLYQHPRLPDRQLSGPERSVREDGSRLTSFAPNDDAFAAGMDALDGASQKAVCEVIDGHVVGSTVIDSGTLISRAGASITTRSGTTVAIEADGENGGLTIGGVPVVGADNYATNGVVHVIGGLILPADAE